MTMTMTMTRRLTAFTFLTTFALLPACGDLGSARVDEIAYEADGSLVVFMATGIHVLAPSLYRESITIPFDDLPVNTAPLASRLAPNPEGAACFGFRARSASGAMVFDESIVTGDLPLRCGAMARCDAGPDQLAEGNVASFRVHVSEC